MTEPIPPRRIAPQTGPHLWSGAALSPADWMLPLGGEIQAEIDPATFLDGSFIEAANAYNDSDLRKTVADWKEAHKDLLMQ